MQKHVLRGLIILSAVILGIGLQSCSKDDDGTSNEIKNFNKLNGIWKIEYHDDDVKGNEEVIPRYYVIEGTTITDKIYKPANEIYILEGETEFTITDVEENSFKFRISNKEYEAQIKRFEKRLGETNSDEKKKSLIESIKMFKKMGKTKMDFIYTQAGNTITAEINNFFNGKKVTDKVTLEKVNKLPKTK